MSDAEGPLDDIIENAKSVFMAEYEWGDGGPEELIAAGVDHVGKDPDRVRIEKDEDGNKVARSVYDIIPDDVSLPIAVREFRDKANNIGSGVNQSDAISFAARKYLEAAGEFFQTEDGTLYYFLDKHKNVYRVSAEGNKDVSDGFAALVKGETGLSPASHGRFALKNIKAHAIHNAPERKVKNLSAWDKDSEELFITDFDGGYYVLDGDSIEHRDNGTDVFFGGQKGTPYEYLEPGERATFPDPVPGELPKWHQQGDLMMRFFGNRINFDDSGIMSPEQQRVQMYLHLHAFAFVDYFTAKPVTAFVGEKGSGKTVIQRSLGKFIFGEYWEESSMPTERDDFEAILINRPLAFLDNFDDHVDWANDIIASVATGSAIARRQLYTTGGIKKMKPNCFIALTSRDPPFRRDDVADRMVVCRVTPVDDPTGTDGFLDPVVENRDTLWSEYLDNLNDIVAELQAADRRHMTSSHRMAGWAIFVRLAAEALGVDDIDGTLDAIQLERALFALEDDSLFRVIRGWLDANGRSVRGKPWTAGELLDEFDEYAGQEDMEFDYRRPQDLAKRLVKVATELDKLFGFEVRRVGRSNAYTFTEPDDDDGKQGLLGYGHFADDDADDESADDADADESEQAAADADETDSEGDGPADTDEPASAPVQDGPSQDHRLTALYGFVKDKESDFDDGVPKELIVTTLSSRWNVTEKKIRKNLEKLCQRGSLYEPKSDGHYRTV